MDTPRKILKKSGITPPSMYNRLICVYFSATDTTLKYVSAFAEALRHPIDIDINLADNLSTDLPIINPYDMVVIAAPVYGGRLPQQVSTRLKELSGNHSNAVCMVVYGNRDYDDALLELTDILSERGFEIIGAGAFIGQHSIFPKVASSRPDKNDLNILDQFASECLHAIETGAKGTLKIKGNRPYKKIARVPLSPSGNPDICNHCGKCVDKCPVGAISTDEPYKTNSERCISCGRCIMVCPKHTRRHTGLKYKLIEAAFSASFSKRKEPEFIII